MLLLQTSSEWVNINISVKYVFNDNILSAQLSSARNYFWVTSQDQRRLLAQAHHWILHITAIRGFLKISCIKTHQEDSSQRCCHESVFIENSILLQWPAKHEEDCSTYKARFNEWLYFDWHWKCLNLQTLTWGHLIFFFSIF